MLRRLLLALALIASPAQASPFFDHVVLPASQSGGKAACFAQDAFSGTSGTAITSHTPDVGGSWTYHTNHPSSTFQLDGSGGVFVATASSTPLAYNGGTPPSADGYVESVLSFKSAAGPDIGVAGRINTAADTFYRAYWARSSNFWILESVVSGSSSNIGASGSTFTSGTKTLRLVMTGTTIKVLVDGAQVISVTDSAIAAAGKAGLWASSATDASGTGIHQTAFVAC